MVTATIYVRGYTEVNCVHDRLQAAEAALSEAQQTITKLAQALNYYHPLCGRDPLAVADEVLDKRRPRFDSQGSVRRCSMTHSEQVARLGEKSCNTFGRTQ